MIRFILVRLLQTILALVGISILVFLLVRVTGDPVDLFRTATSTPEELANIREVLGLDKSLPEQYWIFFNHAVRGDLGHSYIKRRPVTTMIADALPNSMKLGATAFVVAVLAALVLGVFSARRRDSALDNLVKFLAILGQALPPFWVGIMGIWVFSVFWPVLPASGTSGISSYVLPVGTLAFYLLPGMMRLVRSSMLDTLDTEYIKLARIKGLPERVIIWKHALRNALITPLTAAGMILAVEITGEFVIEIVFAWPGLGRMSVEAMMARDFPTVQGTVLFIAVVVLVINLFVDILYAYIDPQIRYQRT
jgi:peptide/nickel transport system permease protein